MKAALLFVAASLALASCAPAAKAPSATTARAPAPRVPMIEAVPPPRPLPVMPLVTGWMDQPATPGTWEYRRGPLGTIATFAADQPYGVVLVCPADAPGLVLFGVSISGPGERGVHIRTETADRPLRTRPGTDTGARMAMVEIAANDPLLDAMALSKGRFAVEVDGYAPLYLPSHAEVSRVIEDCR